ncbi:MAG: sensor histidine kinase [Cyclobacteriaceae bacterium]
MKRLIFLISLLSIGTFSVHCQPETIEDQLDYYIGLTDGFGYNDNDSALWASLKAVEIAHQINTYDALGQAYRVAGIYYGDAGLYDQAIISTYKAINYFDSSTLEHRNAAIAGCYHNLAWYYTYMEDYSKTASLFHQSMNFKPVTNEIDSIDYTVSLHALGSFYYLYLEDYDSGIYYLSKAVDWRRKLDYDLETLAQTEVELCHAYYESGDIANGDIILETVESYPEGDVSKYIENYVLFLHGLKNHQLKKYENALDYFQPVYDWGVSANLLNSPTGINLMRQIVVTARAAEKFELALEILEKLRQVEQETIYKDRQRTTKALEIQFETARKEQELESQEAIIDLQRNVIVIGAIALLIILVLTLIVALTYKKVNQKNKKIETLMRELHHRVKNNLQVISSLLGLQSMQLTDSNAKAAVEESKGRVRAMSLIHQMLYRQDDITYVNIKTYIEELVREVISIFGYEERLHLTLDIAEEEWDIDTALPLGMIVNELVMNAMKHAFESVDRPSLHVSIKSDSGHIGLVVKDNGDMNVSIGDIENSTNFGQRLIRLLVEQMKGQMKVAYSEGLTYEIKMKKVA